jgi:hypothetical protein
MTEGITGTGTVEDPWRKTSYTSLDIYITAYEDGSIWFGAKERLTQETIFKGTMWPNSTLDITMDSTHNDGNTSEIVAEALLRVGEKLLLGYANEHQT